MSWFSDYAHSKSIDIDEVLRAAACEDHKSYVTDCPKCKAKWEALAKQRELEDKKPRER